MDSATALGRAPSAAISSPDIGTAAPDRIHIPTDQELRDEAAALDVDVEPEVTVADPVKAGSAIATNLTAMQQRFLKSLRWTFNLSTWQKRAL